MFRTLIPALTAAAVLGGVASSANAVPMLRLQTSAGADVTIADGGAGDLLGDTGAVLFAGSLAGWSLNVTTGVSAPALGSADKPELDLNSIDVSSSGGGWLKVWLTDTGFDAAPSLARAVSAIGGTTAGLVTYTTYMDASNAAFGTATQLSSFDPFSPTAFSGSASADFTSATPYSLTLLVTIFHQGLGATSFDANVKVPEPRTLLLLGLGLVFVAFAARWGRKAFGAR